MNSFKEPKCAGCQYIENKDESWCYMFLNAPRELPCAQSDKFKPLRDAAGDLFKKNPEFLGLSFIGELLGEFENDRLR